MKDQEEEKQENTTGDASQPNIQDKPDDIRVPTVTPANDSGEPGPDDEGSSDKSEASGG
jgi:hypothetical protein